MKYDFLTTDACTKIRQTMDLLIEYGHMKKKNSLKETYYHYLNPMTMNYNTEDVWKTVGSNSMIDIFQFDTETGQQTIKDIQPTSWLEIAQSNSLMRLQKQEGAEESPAETFVRFKNDINKWYQEMEEWGVPKKDQQILSKVLEQYKGVADTQEAIMILSQLDEFAGFTVKQSHTLRKSIAKFLASIIVML